MQPLSFVLFALTLEHQEVFTNEVLFQFYHLEHVNNETEEVTNEQDCFFCIRAL